MLLAIIVLLAAAAAASAASRGLSKFEQPNRGKRQQRNDNGSSEADQKGGEGQETGEYES